MVYWVYIIELDSAVWCRSRFREQNPDFDASCSSARFYYVGQTALTPAERFEKHKNGVRSSSIVRIFGKYVCPKMCRSYETREEALDMERAFADRLRSQGSAAYSN